MASLIPSNPDPADAAADAAAVSTGTGSLFTGYHGAPLKENNFTVLLPERPFPRNGYCHTYKQASDYCTNCTELRSWPDGRIDYICNGHNDTSFEIILHDDGIDISQQKTLDINCKGVSKVNMLTHPTREYQPTQFDHHQWCSVRDKLAKLGVAYCEIGDRRSCLYELSLNMDLAQKYYGAEDDMVVLHGGRYFWENAAHYLLGDSRGDQTQAEYLEPLLARRCPHPQEVHQLISFLKSNALPHALQARTTITPTVIKRIVHATFRIASYLVSDQCQDMVNGQMVAEANSIAKDRRRRMDREKAMHGTLRSGSQKSNLREHAARHVQYIIVMHLKLGVVCIPKMVGIPLVRSAVESWSKEIGKPNSLTNWLKHSPECKACEITLNSSDENDPMTSMLTLYGTGTITRTTSGEFGFHGGQKENPHHFWVYPRVRRLLNPLWDTYNASTFCTKSKCVGKTSRGLMEYICQGHDQTWTSFLHTANSEQESQMIKQRKKVEQKLRVQPKREKQKKKKKNQQKKATRNTHRKEDDCGFDEEDFISSRAKIRAVKAGKRNSQTNQDQDMVGPHR